MHLHAAPRRSKALQGAPRRRKFELSQPSAILCNRLLLWPLLARFSCRRRILVLNICHVEWSRDNHTSLMGSEKALTRGRFNSIWRIWSSPVSNLTDMFRENDRASERKACDLQLVVVATASCFPAHLSTKFGLWSESLESRETLEGSERAGIALH